MTPRLNSLQLQMAAAVISGVPLTAVQAAWGAGKTAGLVFAADLMARTRVAGVIPWIVDSYPRIARVVLPECRRWLPELGWTYAATDRRWTHAPSGSTLLLLAYYRPATRGAHHNPIEGINASDALIDEAQTLPEEALDRLLGRCRTHTDPRIIVSGLPVAPSRAWWSRRAAVAGGVVLRAASHVNEANLGRGWFAALDQLAPDEYKALVLDEPEEAGGAIYDCWSGASWPGGNVLDGWRYTTAARVRAAVDFGGNKPSVLFIAAYRARHPVTRADVAVDVVFDEVAPDGGFTLTHELAQLVLERAWPRALRAGYAGGPSGRYMLDGLCGDPSGWARDRHSGESDIDLLARAPTAGGLGMRMRTPSDPVRRSVEAGIARTRRRMLGADGVRRLVMTRELWDSAAACPKARTLRRALEGYSRDESGAPVKALGFDDPVDALRYDTAVYAWWGPRPLDGREPRAVVPRAPRLARLVGAR